MTDHENREYSCDQVVPIEQEPRHHLVFENKYIRAFAVEIPAGDRTLCHNHPQDYLLYVASGSEIVSAAKNEEPRRLNYSDGECEMSQAGMTHVVENLGEKPFCNIVIEFAPGAELTRGNDPKFVKGGGTVASAFTGNRAVVFEVSMKPGAELEVDGPAVTANTHRDLPRPSPRIQAQRNQQFTELSWIAPSKVAGLRNGSSTEQRVIIFQLGDAA